MKHKYNFFSVLTILFFITSCGGGGSAGVAALIAPVINSFVSSVVAVKDGVDFTLTWSTSNATSCSASGSWSGDKAISGSEVVTATFIANQPSFILICTSGDGLQAQSKVDVDIYRLVKGLTVDGYISGATIFVDENDNYDNDTSEESTISDNNGAFSIRHKNGTLISQGGTDLDTQVSLEDLKLVHTYSGYTETKIISPVTSIAAFLDGTVDVNTVLGIDSSIDIHSFDPVANKGDGGVNDYLYEKGNQLTALSLALFNVTKAVNSSATSTKDYFEVIAEELDKHYDTSSVKVDIESETFISDVLNNIITKDNLTGLSSSRQSNIVNALKGVLPVVEVKSNDTLTTAVNRFALSTLQTDITSLANGTATNTIINNYNNDVLGYISSNQNVNIGDITPGIAAVADSVSTDEDTPVSINVLLNDSYISTSPITVTAADGSKGTTTVSNGVITYTPSADLNGPDTFNYTISQQGKTSTSSVSISIGAIADAPVINTASTVQADENQTSVTTLSVTDPDGDSTTVTISGTDVSSFSLSSSNVLTFVSAPDFESKSTYYLTINATDGSLSSSKDITVSVTNVNDISPVITSSSSYVVEENSILVIDSSYNAAKIVATDVDGDVLTYSISGTDAASFTVNSANGDLQLLSDADYETKTLYSINVIASDGLFTATQAATIEVLNLNDNAPVIVTSSMSIVEGNSLVYNDSNPASTSIAVKDADNDNSYIFSLSGTDSSLVYIGPSTGVVSLRSDADYETRTAYSITVTVSDGTFSTSKALTINVTNDTFDDLIPPSKLNLVETQKEAE